MPKFMIFPYAQGSKGAKMLAEELGCKRILREGSTYVPQPTDTIINWGASYCPFPQALNPKTEAVTDKVQFFKRLEGTGLAPKAYFSKAAILQAGANYPVFCRTKIASHDGKGIEIAQYPSQLVNAQLYTEGVSKTAEYRIHVGRLPSGAITIIGGQKKIHEPTPGLPADVWAGSGTRFVWTVNGQPAFIPPAVLACVKAAFEKFPELDFGAFDAVWCSDAQKAYVLEINSAPMMTPETAKRYGQFFRAHAGSNLYAVAEQMHDHAGQTPAPVPTHTEFKIKVPQQSITMVQIILAAVGINLQ